METVGHQATSQLSRNIKVLLVQRRHYIIYTLYIHILVLLLFKAHVHLWRRW